MRETPEELEVHVRELRQRREALQAKIQQTRELLTRADARRLAEPENRSSWDKKLNQLEANYTTLKREFELAKMDTERLERELANQKIGVDISLDSMIEHADSGIEAGPESGAPALAGRGVVRIISTPLDKLASLGETRLTALEGFVSHSSQLTPEEQAATLSRLSLARGMLTSDSAGAHGRRQFVLRGALDKIQRSIMHEVTPDEAEALSLCHDRLVSKAERSPAEERLIGLIGGAMNQLQREA